MTSGGLAGRFTMAASDTDHERREAAVPARTLRPGMARKTHGYSHRGRESVHRVWAVHRDMP